jgi:hypothetical protein
VEPNSYSLVPFCVESCGCLGQPAMKGEHALGPRLPDLQVQSALIFTSFVAGTLCGIPVGLFQGDSRLYRGSLVMPARSSGARGFQPGMAMHGSAQRRLHGALARCLLWFDTPFLDAVMLELKSCL